jgi:class 3 adenylate cyclase/tetratricopeptide (TPR) repeat protein
VSTREHRKTVTVLFCDLAGSTALGESVDPERLRTILAAYFERMKAIVEGHGGSVEKFIGDAVMAVFGVPVVHEDDALRAVRAAVEMRDALPTLGLEGRIGVMTGQVVTGTDERLATGDAVNVAARLEQAADPGEVLLGQPTLALVQDAVEVEAVGPRELKGKAEPVPAYRLVRVHDPPERRHDAPFVGREPELRLLREAWQRARSGRCCELVSVVGDAGIGKSRLVAEAVASVDATVVRGRCLPYGEGITYWPVVEVLKQLDRVPADVTAAKAIRSLLGESEAATSAEEIAWAFRKTLEDAASDRPVVVVFDDIQWGEETFHDLIEHVALLSSGASILLLCMARPALTEQRATWPVTVRLEPLPDDEVDELIPDYTPADLRERISRAAGGNPLFVEEMVAMAGEAEGEVVVPPTLHALLAARLDQLEPAERRILEGGSIEGEVFHRGAVQALAPEETQVTPRLAALVRKELIRPDRPQIAGEDGFRFRHLLIRDAAYEALPKSARADLHQRLAAWLEAHGTELVELDEIVGYHLEQACGYRAELGLPSDDALTSKARRRLTAGGQRAAFRQDYGAAASLLERAAALMPPSEFDLALETQLVDVLLWAGKIDQALRRAESLAHRATTAGDEVGQLCGRIKATEIRTLLEPEGETAKLNALVEEALPIFEAARDDLALFIGYSALGQVAIIRARADTALASLERADACARRAGVREEYSNWLWRAACCLTGTTPVSGVLSWLDANEPGHGQALSRAPRANALAMLGRFDEARAILTELRAGLAERGGGTLLAGLTRVSAEVELLADDPAAAAELGTEACRLFAELGEKGYFSTAAGCLAQALYGVDRLEEAEAWAGRAAELGGSDDAATGLLWRQVRAKVLARRGEHAEAEQLAHEAIAIADATDFLNGQGDGYADLAEVLLLGGKRVDAVAALEQALERYQRKENLASAERARARLDELAGPRSDA